MPQRTTAAQRRRGAQGREDLEKIIKEFETETALILPDGRKVSIGDVLRAGIKAHLAERKTSDAQDQTLRVIAARFLSLVNRKAAQAEGREGQAEQDHFSDADRSYIRTLTGYGCTAEQVAKMMGLPPETIRRVAREKPKPFSWRRWTSAQKRQGRRLDF